MYIDSKTIQILKFIYQSKEAGRQWSEIYQMHSDQCGCIDLLTQLTKEGYIRTADYDSNWIDFSQQNDLRDAEIPAGFRSVTTARANTLIQTRQYDLMKWAIPTLISVAALIVSIIALVKG